MSDGEFPSFNPPPVPDSLYSPDDLARLRAIESTETWQFLRHGLEGMRDALIARTPKTPLELQMAWGKLELVADLLQTGPRVVLDYLKMQRHVDAPGEHGIDAWRFKRGEV